MTHSSTTFSLFFMYSDTETIRDYEKQMGGIMRYIKSLWAQFMLEPNFETLKSTLWVCENKRRNCRLFLPDANLHPLLLTHFKGHIRYLHFTFNVRIAMQPACFRRGMNVMLCNNYLMPDNASDFINTHFGNIIFSGVIHVLVQLSWRDDPFSFLSTERSDLGFIGFDPGYLIMHEYNHTFTITSISRNRT